MSVGCINMKGSACALGNVPKLNQQRTLMSAGYFRLQRRALPDSVKKVLQMNSVQQLGRIAAIQRIYHNIIFDLLHMFVLQLINLVGFSRANDHGSFFTITSYTYTASFYFPAIIASSFPTTGCIIVKLTY